MISLVKYINSVLVIQSCSDKLLEKHLSSIKNKYCNCEIWKLSSGPNKDARFSKTIFYPEKTLRFEPLKNQMLINELNHYFFKSIVWIYADGYGVEYSNIRVLAGNLNAKEKWAINNLGQWLSYRKEDYSWDLLEEIERSYEFGSQLILNSIHEKRETIIKNGKKSNNIKKLTFISNSLVLGGTELLLLEKISFFIKQGYEIQLIMGSGGELLPDFTEFPIRLKVFKPDVSYDVIDLRIVPWIIEQLEEFQPDVLISYQTIPFLPALLAGSLANVPLLLRSANGSVSENFIGSFQYKRMLQYSSLYDKVVSVSQSIASSLELPKEKNCVIPGTTVKEENYLFNSKNLRLHYSFITVARLDKDKGLSYLLKAVSKIILRYRNVSFTIVGDGPERYNLENEINQLGIQEYVSVLGNQKNIPKLLNENNIFILPSLFEGLPISIIEAMMSKCMVIATNVGGIPELIDHKVNGILIEPKNVDSLEEAILHVIEAPELITQYGKRAKEKALKNFTLTKMMEKWEKLLQDEWSKLLKRSTTNEE